MATINEIKNLIKTKIEGQGSQVDIGNGLPQILNGIADLIQETQSLSANGYKFYGFYNVENDSGEEDAGYPTVPADYQNQHYFILVYNAEDEYFGVFEPYNAEIWQMLENSVDGTGIIMHVYNKIIRGNEETTNGYVTPKCLVDYALPYEDFSDYQHGEELSQDDWQRLEDAIVVKYRGEFWSRIEVIYNTWVDVIAALWDDQYSPIRIFGSLQYEMQNGVPTLTNINAVCLAQDNNGKEYFAVAEI